jgi:c-di-GMP-related signal transduction protein
MWQTNSGDPASYYNSASLPLSNVLSPLVDIESLLSPFGKRGVWKENRIPAMEACVIAEGIENVAMLELVQHNDLQAVQSYLLGRPSEVTQTSTRCKLSVLWRRLPNVYRSSHRVPDPQCGLIIRRPREVSVMQVAGKGVVVRSGVP